MAVYPWLVCRSCWRSHLRRIVCRCFAQRHAGPEGVSRGNAWYACLQAQGEGRSVTWLATTRLDVAEFVGVLARRRPRWQSIRSSLQRLDLIVIDELGYLPIDRAGAESLFGFFNRCYEQTSVIVTTNLPFAQWPATFAGDERMTGALLNRLTHRLEILSIDGESYGLRQSRKAASQKEKTKIRSQPPRSPAGLLSDCQNNSFWLPRRPSF